MTNHFEFHTFPTGLRLVLVPMVSTKTATILVLVGTGSRYETKKINGISHFLEHMMFKGTTKRPGALDISHELDSIGADYNAFTSQEYTGYYIKAAADKFDLTLDVISDIFLNSKLDENEIAKEKRVIIEEINMYKDTPMRYVVDLFDELLYGDQPLGWPIAGQKDGILKLKREDFTDYFNSHYFAKNTIVVVAGNVDPSKAKEKIEETFSNIREHSRLEPVAVKEEQSKPVAKIFHKKTDQTHFCLGVRTFGADDPREYPLDLMSVILGGGMSSRLWIEVREKRGMAYYVRTSADEFKDTGSLVTRAGVDNKRVLPAIEIVLNEYKRLREEKVEDKELRKAKDFIKGKVAIALESSDDLASFYAEQQLLRKETLTPEEKLARIEKVTFDQIRDVANEIFSSERLNLSLIGPFKKEDKGIYKVLTL